MTKSLTVPRNILTNLNQNNKESVTTIKQVYTVQTRWRKGQSGDMTELQYLISKLEEHQYVYYTRRNSEETTIKQVYNLRTRWRKGQGGDMTELQYLISKLEEHQYVYCTRCNSEETTLQDIFFAHPKSIKLLNMFPTVLVLDSTYKTNIYRMPLFEIVGCTSTKMTYSVGFVFLFLEKEDHFTLALKMVKGLLSSKDSMPKVIVTNKDTALMNVIATIFPETDIVLCFFFSH